MIKISNLSKSYGENAVLENINLQIKKGEVLALIGFSGSGKSTLLKIIAGLEDYDSGTVELGSEKIGMAFQYSALFDSLNIADNVAFPLCYGKQARTDLNEEELFKIVSNKLSTVGLSGVETLSPSELSGGMKKRVSFARAIVNDPELILYDEPTAGLDPVASTIIEDIIVKLQQETKAASVVVTHQASTIRRTASKVAMLYESKLVWQGSSEELFDPNNQNPFAKQFREGDVVGPMQVKI